MDRKFQRYIISQVKRAVVDYGMIAEGDRVAVGLSGGKDSGVLLHALNIVRRVSPVKFSLHGVFVDPGWEMEVNVLREFCEKEGVPFYYKPTNIAQVVFDIRQEKNPCALCANLRRGALNTTARELGCNKVALGHHLDDAIETFFMSLFYNGQFRTFSPITYLSRSGLTMIRPLIYLTQEQVKEMARQKKIPVLDNPCPVSGKTVRQEMKEFVQELVARYPELHLRFLNAFKTADLRNLWPVV
ncbi:tRNA 2-thiocytidine biosynthesis TtcA family protein [Desulfovirgula thermocuniculi]|uniref:tRNA 2-thiocytidine biosynthesis TtcA family protein n=1 Tax=Desulfovirgula thermocuniculi TaxID=348842 RepID=UPI0004223C7D|nr:ATP-binding protein [Desulfovirgula thermocuniculi]